MKFIVALSALVAAVAAQDLASLPECGRTCVNSMLGQAASLGCPGAPDARCLCNNVNFANGLRDCSAQACGAAVSAQVISFGQQYCANAGATAGAAASTLSAAASSVSSAASAASSASGSASSALSSASSSVSSALASVSSSIASAGSSASSRASSAASSASSAAGAMHTQAPLAGAAVLGLAALLI